MKLIGKGEWGSIFLIEKEGHFYAMKVAHPNRVASAHLLREFHILKSLSHEAIVRVFEFGYTKKGPPFFTMEYVKGKPFTEAFENYSEDFLVGFAKALAGISYIHERGLVHGDLKPENLIVSKHNDKITAKILDFGFAGAISSGKGRGSIGYMAPEIFRGRKLDIRTDLYSIGVILYETLTRRLPFPFKDLSDLIKRQNAGTFTPVREINKDVPQPVAEIVESLISPVPEVRPPSAQEIAAKLTDMLKGKARVIISSERRFLTPPLIEREDIIKVFRKSLSGSRKSGNAIFLKGPAGIGKTRLLREFKFIAQTAGWYVFTINLSDLREEASPLFSSIRGQLGESFKKEVVGNKYRAFEAVLEGLLRVSKNRAVILIDDLHFASKEDISLLRYIVFSMSHKPIIIAAALKDNGLDRLLEEFQISNLSEIISVPPLTEEGIFKFIEGVLGKVSQIKELSQWLFTETEGNPLLIMEALKSYREKKILQPQPTQWDLDLEYLSEVKLPKKIERHYTDYVSKLSKEALEVLKVLSISYIPVSVYEIKETTSMPENVIYQILEKMVNEGVLILLAEENTYKVNSHHLRDTVLSSVTKEESTRYHRKLAEIYLGRYYKEKAPRLLFAAAMHFRSSRLRKKAFEISLLAYQTAKELRDIPKALDFIESAYKLRKKGLSPRELIHLLTAQAELNSYLGEENKALDNLKEALQLSERYRLAERADILVKLGNVMVRRENANAAIGYLDKFIKEHASSEPKLLFTSLYNLTWAYLMKRDFTEAEETLKRLEATYENMSPKEKVMFFNLKSTLFWEKGEVDDALKNVKKAKKILEDYSLEDSEMSKILHNLGKYHWHLGNLDEALSYFQKTLEIQKENFDIFRSAYTHSSLSLIYQQKGEAEKAKAQFEEALTLIQKIGNLSLLGDVFINLAVLMDSEGKLDSALEYLHKAEKLYKMAGLPTGAIVNINKATFLEKRGKLKDALEEYRKGLRIASKNKEMYWEFWALLYIFKTYRLLDKKKELRELEKKLEARTKSMDVTQKINYLSEKFLLYLSEKKDEEKLKTILKEIESLLKETTEPSLRYIYFTLRGKYLASRGQLTEAFESFKEAISLSKKANLFYESAQAQNDFVETTLQAIESGKVLDISYHEIHEVLEEAEATFKKIGAEIDLNKTRSLKDRLLKVILYQSHRPPQRYLKALYQISEITNLYLDKPDFFEALLDRVTELTEAERGALFLFKEGDFILAASKDLDRVTLSDAKDFSRSAIKEASTRDVPILSNDAINDPKFGFARSVKINNIRSILVTRLVTRNRLIGVLYLDSRSMSDLFKKEEAEFIASVSHILAATIDKTLAYRKLEERLLQLKEGVVIDTLPDKIIAYAPDMVECLHSVEQVAPTDTSVLLIGETGTGKSVLAHLIHKKSKRKGPFIKVDLTNVSETLFESELFGYAKGAFTGAYQQKKGLLEEASGGTLFLDEITNIPLPLQAKLLTVIEEKVFRRLGENKERKAEFRVICATNKNILEEMKAGRFREDLYYRLSSWVIKVPPLRERVEDIPYLAEIFMGIYNEEFGKDIKGFSPETLEVLLKYPWPGNVRELRNIIERAVLLAKGSRIEVEDLGPNLIQSQREAVNLKSEQKKIEYKRVKEALSLSRGNVTKAAQYLGIRREQLYRLMQRYNLDPNNFRKSPHALGKV